MPSLQTLWVAAIASVALADGGSVTHIHVRVHTTRASQATTPRVTLLCPLDQGLVAPRITLPCPYDCNNGGGDATRACVVYPAASQAFCAGDCVRADACAVMCLPPLTSDNAWSLCATTNTSTDTDTCTSGVDASVVQGLQVMDGLALLSPLQQVSISGSPAYPFHIPASLFNRLGRHATSIALENVVLDGDSIDMGGARTSLTELRVVNAGIQECPFQAAQLPSLSILDLTSNRIHTFNGSEFQNLRELYLGNNAIQDLPVGSLPSRLQVLNSSGNALTQFPAELSTLKELRILTLDQNAIRSLPKDAFSLSSAITEVSLRNTSLVTVPKCLFRLRKLSKLNLDQNDLSQRSASNFSRFSRSLTHLSVNAARLQRLPIGLKNHSNLSSLSLASNNLSTDTPLECSQFPNSLTSFNLSYNSLRMVPRGLNDRNRLASLDLSGNAFDGRIDLSLMPSSLTSLALDNCNLSQQPANLRRLSLLRNLSLQNNPLVGDFPVRDLPALTTLRLDGTNITGLESFSSLSESLELFSCQDCTALVSLPPLPASLKMLTLSGIAMKTLSKGVLPSTLLSLSITDVSQLSTAPEDLAPMTRLSELTLARCNLSTFPALTSLPTLQKLSLAQNSLVSFSAALPLTTILDLSENRLQSFNVRNTTRLTHLSLARNRLDHFPQAIINLTTLQSLRLEGNPIRGFQPSDKELAFLLKIPFLSMEQEQFATDCESPTQMKQFSVCLNTNKQESPPTILGDDTANMSTAKNQTSGIIVALDILLVLGLVVAIAFIVWRDKRERRAFLDNTKQSLYDARAAERSPRMSTLDVNTLAAYRIESDAVVKSRRIATVALTDVWLAIYAAQRVAVKQLKPDLATPQAIQRFTHEATLLSELKHPHIIAFVGVTWTDGTDLAVVTVFAGKGDLGHYIKTVARPEDGRWDAPKLQIALGTAEAIAYLHSLAQPVQHRNLQSRNVLLDDHGVVKLAGFDAAIHVGSLASRSLDATAVCSRVGSVRWLAPELINGLPYDASVDIFSLGVILSELDTHTRPYASVQDATGESMGDDEIKSRVADGTLRLALSPTCPRAIAELALRCSSYEPHDRPDAISITNQLRELHDALVIDQEVTGVLV